MIDQKIYDYNDELNLGKVNYTPFLTAANPQAMPDTNAPLPTADASPASSTSPADNQNNTATPDVSRSQTDAFLGLDWTQVAILVLLGITAVLLVFVALLLHRRKHK